MRKMLTFVPLVLAALPALAAAAPTEVLPLSGMGEANEAPVYWDFRLDAGRGAGEWKRIVVPSCWEQQGFGAYYYGTQGRGKPDDDPVIPKETGTYRRSFEAPGSWREREIHIVFEAAMTDTTVFINGQQAGDTHQGGFYRFSYDITRLVKPGRNDLEVRVAKESANKSVNRRRAARRLLDLRRHLSAGVDRSAAANHIAWTAHRRARRRQLRGHDAPERRRAQGHACSRAALRCPWQAIRCRHGFACNRRHRYLSPRNSPTPALWTAETPHLYSVKFSLLQGKTSLHELEQRFGFRTLEVRPRDGVYLNGRKIVLKGVNRHSFDADTGRTLTRAAEFRGRAADQGREHERGAHVALSARPVLSRCRRRARSLRAGRARGLAGLLRRTDRRAAHRPDDPARPESPEHSFLGQRQRRRLEHGQRRRIRALGPAAAPGAASLGDSRRHQHRPLRELRQHREAERGPRNLHAHGIPARPVRRRHRRGDARLLGCHGQEPHRGGRILLGLRR